MSPKKHPNWPIAVQIIAREYSAGTTLDGIIKMLTEIGIVGKNGKPFSNNMVSVWARELGLKPRVAGRKVGVRKQPKQPAAKPSMNQEVNLKAVQEILQSNLNDEVKKQLLQVYLQGGK